MLSKLFLDNYFSDFQSVISEFLKEYKNKNISLPTKFPNLALRFRV